VRLVQEQQIPNAGNHWVGTNVTGFKNPEFDAACHATSLSLPGEDEYGAAFATVQSVFARSFRRYPSTTG